MPRADPFRLDALLLERLAHAFGHCGGFVPVAGPRLDDEPVQQDVPERCFVALVAGLLLGFAEVRSRTVEVVDVAQPLSQLEHDAAVDGDRQRGRRVERVRAFGCIRIEAAAEEEIRADPRSERRRSERRLLVLASLEELAAPRCARCPPARGPPSPAYIASCVRQRARCITLSAASSACSVKFTAAGFALVPVVDLGERHQRP